MKGVIMKLFSILIVLVSLTVIPSLGLTQVNLYTEDFANGVLQNTWYRGFEGQSNAMDVKSFSSPSGDDWVGVLGNDSTGNSVGMTVSGDTTWTDYYYEAQVYIETDSAFYYGLEFRCDSIGSRGYNFVVQANPMFGPTRIRFRRRDGISPSSIVSINDWINAQVPGGIPTQNGWNKMAVEANGNEFKLFFNDQELPGGPFTDTTYASGAIGTYVFGFDTAVTVHLKTDDISVNSLVTSIKNGNDQKINTFSLAQNYPNPFNPSTQISFNIPSPENVQMVVFNSLGQKMRTLINENLPSGTHQVAWNGRDNFGNELPAGIYYYQIKAGEFQQTRKMLFVK
jgi:hypothetical protein